MNPFLTIDELRQKRDEDLDQRIGGLTSTFGDVPLALANFQQVAADRAQKAALTAKREGRADEDQTMQREAHQAQLESHQAAMDKSQQDASNAALKTFAAGEIDTPVFEKQMVTPEGPVPQGAPEQAPIPTQVARPQTDEEILAKAAQDPKLGRQDDNSVRAALATEREASQKRELDRQYREAQTTALNGKGDERAKELEYHWANLAQKKEEEKGRNARAAVSNGLRERMQKLKEAGKISEGGLKDLRNAQDELAKIDQIRSDMDQGNYDTGPVSGAINSFLASVHLLNPKDAAFQAQVVRLFNTNLHAFAGSQMTEPEIATFAKTAASMKDSREVFDALLVAQEEAAQRRMQSILQVEEGANPERNSVRTRMNKVVRGEKPGALPPPVVAPPPQMGGLETIHRKGHPEMTLQVTPAQAKEKRKGGNWE